MADDTPKPTTLFPKPGDKGQKGPNWNGEWFPGPAPAMGDPSGYYKDTNGQWWYIRGTMGGLTSIGPDEFHASIVMPKNQYGRSPGWETGVFSSLQAALDGVDAFAIQARLLAKPSGFPWWLVILGALYYADKRKGR